MTFQPIPFPFRRTLLGLASAVILSFSGPAMAGGFSAMVSDLDTGAILTADQIDAPRAPDLMSRLITITMGIQDIVDETLDPDEMLEIRPGQSASAMTALQATALGEAGYRAPMTALAARIGHNARLFNERMKSIRGRIGMRASEVAVVRGTDGGPAFDGRTTLRDTVRLATSLLRAHPDLTAQVFGPATGGIETTLIWMVEEEACLLSAKGQRSGRTLIAALSGAPDDASCFELAAQLLAEQDLRIVESR